jgi:hypothetical protein
MVVVVRFRRRAARTRRGDCPKSTQLVCSPVPWRRSAWGHRLPSVGTRGASVVPSAPDIAAAARGR